MATKRKVAKKPTGQPETIDPRAPLKPSPTVFREILTEVRAVLDGLTPPETPCPGDLVAAMIHYSFAEGLADGFGQEAARRIAGSFVDLNEFRVTEAFEVAEGLADLDIPDLFDRCLALRSAIGQVYNDQNAVSLDFLREASVTERNQFLARVPGLQESVARWLTSLISFEECIFSGRSTLRVQQRLGFDPKAAGVAKFFEELTEMLVPFGHLPLMVAPERTDGVVHATPELSVASLVLRLGPSKK